MIKGLYIHIPFCDKICTYCDFAKLVANDEWKERYINALLIELEHYSDHYEHLETIYIGGGTPSSLSLSLLDQLLTKIESLVPITNVKEWTIEANPDDISEDFITLLEQHHLTRISLGVQTTSDRLLQLIGRGHTKQDIKRALRLIDTSKISSYNLDFIYGLPTQTKDELEADLAFLILNTPPHISYYSLILEENTKMQFEITNERLEALDEDLVAEYGEWIEDTLKECNYHKYEISNYARGNAFSKHNLLYWNLEEYIGIGMAAASQFDNARFVNPRKISTYINQIHSGIFDPIEEPFDEAMEFLLMGLRKTEGISTLEYRKRFGILPWIRYPGLQKHLENGLLIQKKDRLYFSTKGMRLSNQVLLELF